MRPNPTQRRLRTGVAVFAAAALVFTSAGAADAHGKDPSKDSRKFRHAVTSKGVARHLDALQGIADANGGTRASGTPGFNKSRDYVVKTLRAAGYRPTVQSFTFPYFQENKPAAFSQVSPDAKTYASPADFITMDFSGSGDVTAAVVPVDTDFSATDTSSSGCEAADFAGFPTGSVALMQRGTCDFGIKVENAQNAGAAAALVFNRGTEGNTDAFGGTLGRIVKIPALSIGSALGKDLSEPAGTKVHIVTDTTSETRTTYNVIAETRKGDPSNVVMAGAHLDSVVAGPGINDNGSGSATILEVAQKLAKVKKIRNKVRFAWWGAEEEGLLGAEHYVGELADANPDALGDIATYLNFDMVGSPNFVRFVYDGDNSTGEGATGPAGSAQTEKLFNDYFASQGLATEPTAFDGRSDYGPFIENGVAAGGLFTGAEGLKTPAQAATYGGEAGVAYDKCYHQACDDINNISWTAIDQMSDAVAHAVYTLSQSTYAINGKNGKAGHGGKGHWKGHKRGHKHHAEGGSWR